MRLIQSALTAGGVLLCLMVMAIPFGTGVSAQTLPDRPTLTPTAAPRRERATPVPSGRITGTVIDLTTGAPVSGVEVIIGGVSVMSDSNGNYDRNGLAAGSYSVALALRAEQGTPAQGAIDLTLAQGETKIQHLAFRSPVVEMPPVAAPVPAALPATGGESASLPLLLTGLTMIGAALLLRRRTN